MLYLDLDIWSCDTYSNWVLILIFATRGICIITTNNPIELALYIYIYNSQIICIYI